MEQMITKEASEHGLRWYQDARFGMFIHWGSSAMSARRLVEAVEEVVSYELHGNTLCFNFDRRRHLYASRMISSSATIFVGELMVVERSEQQVIRQIRKMLDG